MQKTQLSFTYIDTTPWETIQGRRVPKQVTANLSITVLHTEGVPNWGTQFLGISQLEEQVGSLERKASSSGVGAEDAVFPYVSGLGGGPKNQSGYQNRPKSAPSETAKG